MDSIEEIIKKFALKNALDYGKAKEGVVIAKLLGENPEFKEMVGELSLKVSRIVGEVNLLSKQEIEKGIENYRFEKKPEKERVLPELNVEKPVLRMAPNPNGPLHVGHARMIILNDEYHKKYGGELILRFDDTDPKNPEKIPLKQAYDLIEQDLNWLGVDYTKKIYASKRLVVYYEHFRKCLEKGIAYVCTCKDWSTRKTRIACECRGNSVEKNLELWSKINSYKEGEAVGRIKTDLNHPNPAIVDWVAFRIVDHPEHPLVEKSVKLWPTLDFASAVDDHDLNVTVIIRGKDLMVSEQRQKYIYSAFDWTYPLTITYGKISIKNSTVSKSEIVKGIREGVFTGFDDPKLPTLSALRRRGYSPQAIRNFILNFGLNENETTVDWEILNNFNRKEIDFSTPRYFFVSSPVEVKVKIKGDFKIKLHPSAEIGFKHYSFNGETVFLVDKKYLSDRMHLKGLVTIDKNGNVLNEEAVVIPWVEKNRSIPVKIIKSEMIIDGFVEEYCSNLKIGSEVQFEKLGFCRLDSKGVFYFTHV
ncbi:MAG: glutamate--tRNA ligase [Candidatus Marsarchaeota archaeon]|nr:glutamate--tRNA ligase [Candidatus Marsarchaeota archaeon]